MSRFGLDRDPLPWLLNSSNLAIRLRAAHELDDRPIDRSPVLDLPAVKRVLRKQQADGPWRLTYLKNVGKDVDLWVHFGLCRARKRYSF
jgi:hypothetical protein